jgi:hypothetical protein
MGGLWSGLPRQNVRFDLQNNQSKKGLRCDSRKSTCLASTGLEFKPQYCAPPIKIEKEHE